MGLSIKDMQVGAIVDHMFEVRKEDDEIVPRERIRRGIIVKIDGNGTDSVKAVYVQYAMNGEPELTAPAELVKHLPAKHRVAREAYRRITGQPRHVGAVFNSRNGVVRRKIEDNLALSVPRGEAAQVVKPEFDEAVDESGIGLTDSQP